MENEVCNKNLDKLILFPTVLGDKICLVEFLDASKRLVDLVNDLGRVFFPLSYDMANNINKLVSSNSQSQSIYIEDLLLVEKSSEKESAPTFLLWLKRSLTFLLVFFQCLVDDPTGPENLDYVMEKAYAGSLEEHHAWVTRQLFSLFKKALPGRTVVMSLLKKRMHEDVNVLDYLNEICITLNSNICHIDKFYEINGINVG